MYGCSIKTRKLSIKVNYVATLNQSGPCKNVRLVWSTASFALETFIVSVWAGLFWMPSMIGLTKLLGPIVSYLLTQCDFILWLVKTSRVTLSTNQRENLNQLVIAPMHPLFSGLIVSFDIIPRKCFIMFPPPHCAVLSCDCVFLSSSLNLFTCQRRRKS